MGRRSRHVLIPAALFFGNPLGKLNLQQERFVAAYIGKANGNATEAARIAGYKQPGMHGSRLMKNDEINAAIAEYRAEIKARGIAEKQNRIDAANDRHRRMQQVIEERAVHPWNADVPGGTTGLIVKQLKSVKHIFEPDPEAEDGKAVQITVETWEAAVDTALLKSMLDHEKQIAQEVGEWVEKGELTGKDGKELMVVFSQRQDGPQ